MAAFPLEEDKEKVLFDREIKTSQGSSSKNLLKSDKKPGKKTYPKSIRPAEKIRIDTLQDLNKLTFTQIKSLQIWNLEGKLFEQAYQDALHATKSDKLIKHNISSLELKINYKTEVRFHPYLYSSEMQFAYSDLAISWAAGLQAQPTRCIGLKGMYGKAGFRCPSCPMHSPTSMRYKM